MINLGIGEFYIKMTIDGESYDPFSAETLKVLAAPYASNRQKIVDASRRKYASRASDSHSLARTEEAPAVRREEDEAMLEHKTKNNDITGMEIEEGIADDREEALD
jgi:hypothetical protein